MKQRRQSTQSQSPIAELAGLVATLAVPVSGSLVQRRTPVSLQNSESSFLPLSRRHLLNTQTTQQIQLRRTGPPDPTIFCLREPIASRASRHTFQRSAGPPYLGGLPTSWGL